MIERRVESTILHRLHSVVPAVVLLGPRQVGKTTLARRLAAHWSAGAVYLDMERPADRLRLEDADAYLRAQAPRLVVIDEIHRVPELFAVLRGIIDDRRAQGQRFGHFLLLGSASLDLMQQSPESLAGRVAYVDMHPVDGLEAVQAGLELDTLWCRGGFPDSLLAADDRISFAWRSDFVRSYLERDVPMFAPRMPSPTLGRLWTMLAHQQGGMLNASALAASLGVSAPAVGRYVDLLADLHLVRRLAPWSANPGKRLVKTPKVYVRDSGIVHALLGLANLDALLGHPVVGTSYEGFVLETLIGALGPAHSPWFYRTHDGSEIDLLLAEGGKPVVAIEVKRSTAPSVSRGFGQACNELGITQRWVVCPVHDRFALRQGAQAIGLADLAGVLARETGA
jgi:predicted AAA+ superfamily ATPase